MKSSTIKEIINQYRNKELGVCNKGCRCHSILNIEVEDGVVVDHNLISKAPYFEKTLEEFWGNYMIEEIQDTLVWKQSDKGLVIPFEDESILNEDDGKVKGAYKDNGKWMVQDECGLFSDGVVCAVDDYNASKISSGKHKILVEIGCWNNCRCEYSDEGNTEFRVDLLDNEPMEGQIEMDMEAIGYGNKPKTSK